MLRLEQITAAGLLTAAGTSLILSGILRLLHGLYRREYLSSWAWSWLALFFHFIFASAALLATEGEPSATLPFVAVALGLVAGLGQATWLLLGTHEITQGRPLPRRRARLLVLGLTGVGALLSLVAYTGGGSSWSRDFILDSFRALVVGTVFFTSAIALWRLTDWRQGAGRRLVIIGFLLYGLHQVQYFAVELLQLVKSSFIPYSLALGFMDVILQLIVGLGIVILFLEEEREGVVVASRQIEHLAYHDPLTGLPNRKLFLDRLAQELSAAPRRGTQLAVMFLDLDRFKVINDSLGHSFGDELLASVAQRLKEAVRRVDTVARLGGDEFTLLLLDLSRSDDARKVGEKVLESLRRPFQLHGHEIYVSTSIGISVFPKDGGEAETLLKNADIAMYQAKEKGRDNLQLYSPTMSALALERLDLESDLRRALANDEFDLVFQPILELASGTFECVEALVRWQHPGRGLLAPSQFLPLTEMIGMSYELDLWVLENACRRVRQFHRAGLPDLRVAVNLSARAFHHPDLVRQVQSLCARVGFDTGQLEIEVTENLAMQNVEMTLGALRGLKDLGIRISIDDFGIGYSSLSYLRTFPVDIVKIDQSFIRDLAAAGNETAIARAVIAMAHSLNLTVVAEGVEDKEQLEILRQERCHRLQGFLLARPLTWEQCRQFLLERQAGKAASTGVRQPSRAQEAVDRSSIG